MNFAVRGLTPTQLAARERHLRFTKAIAEKAEELKKSKLQLANEQMVAALKAEIAALEPESFPAETDPPKPQEADPAGIWPWPYPLEFKPGTSPSVKEIQIEVAKFYKVSVGDIISARRNPEIVLPRQVGYYLARELTPLSLPDIARRFGGRDHSSAHHGIKKIKARIASDSGFALDVVRITEAVMGRRR
jgi:hypothetical protein